MDIYETDLPGVGKKHEVEIDGGERIVIVTHNTGKREVYLKEGPDADGEKQFELSDRLARTVGTILEGAYFQPIQSSSVETMLSEELAIEWYSATEGGEIVGQKIGDVGVRDRTGVSIVAIQRGDEVIAPPGPETRIEDGDTVVVVGDRDDCAAFEQLLASTPEK